MKVLVAMSGGVDSSVAAALLVEAGHEVTGVTMKLWGGASDTGCCSVADVDDARRVAEQLGIDHQVFNFGDDFTRTWSTPTWPTTAAGRTPNPCIECNRHLKFDRFCTGPTPSASTRWPPVTTPASSATAPASAPGSGGRPGQGPELRPLHASAPTCSTGCCCRWVS